jgi:PleD family two-component response regulator
MKAEHRRLLDGAVVEEQIIPMEMDRNAERPFRRGDAGDVIDVRVSQENAADSERLAFGKRQQIGHFVSRIDQHRVARISTANDESILEKRRDGSILDYDRHAVILAVLDDLMFTSKIRAAAGQLGIAVRFARTADAALAEMRHGQPALVILDLNNPRIDPLAIVKTMKLEPALASIATVGFVSHVQADLIDAARKAGVDEVLARSAFAARLPEILSAERTRQS